MHGWDGGNRHHPTGTYNIFLSKVFYYIERCRQFIILPMGATSFSSNQMEKDFEIVTSEIADVKMIGFSNLMLKVNTLIKQIAQSDATVLIQGETGTGKELVARTIHINSNRKRGAFVAVNCGAFSEKLFESELFGHVRGAYTDAWRDKKGRFELADGGTLFLDEIGELSQSCQVKLLRVLQEKAFEKVGGTKTVKADVRILAATNKNLKKEVQKGMFRQDLFYRLNVIKVNVPPLRDRKEDIPLLIRHFLTKYYCKYSKSITGISDSAIDALKNYAFPGNVRELENFIERAVVLTKSGQITVNELPEDIFQNFKRYECDNAGQQVKKDELLKVLREITLVNCSGKSYLWHKKMRCITIEKIFRFFVEANGKWFSRKDFEKFLRNHSKSDTDKYKTAGEYLKILKGNNLCIQNGKKANKSAYRLAGRFIKKTKHH
jgi:transcriptional regulator with PAS, ATPase and Fis domain